MPQEHLQELMRDADEQYIQRQNYIGHMHQDSDKWGAGGIANLRVLQYFSDRVEQAYDEQTTSPVASPTKPGLATAGRT